MLALLSPACHLLGQYACILCVRAAESASKLRLLTDRCRYCGFMSHIIGCFIPCICLCPIDDLPPGHQAYAGPITWTCCCVFGYWPALICPCDIRPVPRRQQAVINAGGPVVQYMTTHPIVEFER